MSISEVVDIVERLRNAAAAYDECGWHDAPIPVGNWQDFITQPAPRGWPAGWRTSVLEAAAEIEGLRERLRSMVDDNVKLDIETSREICRLRDKLAEYENVPVRLRHIMRTGRMPDADDPR